MHTDSTLRVRLQTERECSPLSLHTGRPEFTWSLCCERRLCRQKSWHLTVAKEDGSLLWDSGICQGQQLQALYGGPEIPPETACLVTLEIEDDAGDRAQVQDRFRTDLRAESFDDPSWGGARWIGTDTRNLRAEALSVFKLSAELTLQPGSTVLESGQPAQTAPGVTRLACTQQCAQYHLEPGRYVFRVTA